ncbi:protein of unknown function [Hymenobacter daecheongensis DSM 21074]|uniref:DUF4260 domain-containing protein n=1 Tax=Hymenobacter daecheongensis DSM 21074 TaxID=1121955 RepID=A0A1M6JNP7_9BACT|nr:DUF4260 domain-containing protein [Hymenobacter daecheongensis]SHJ48304.1 protein of unknown function [Hymenobacter daecheongensis DSM 21074]
MKILLKSEDLAELLLALLVFSRLPYAWWVLPALFLLPDLSMLGYLAGPRAGAFCYNLAHNKVAALALGVAGWWLAQPTLLLAGCVLLFHLAFDRLLGYGLKYGTSFHDTHLGRVGKEKSGPVAA